MRRTSIGSTATRRRFLQAGGVGTVLGLAGCVEGTPAETSDDGDPITIGGVQPFSGPFALYGTTLQRGVEFAINEINADGGVLDRDLAVESVDTGSDPSEAVTVFTRMVEQDDVVAAVGPVDSDVGIRVAATAEDLEVPLLLHMSGTHAALSKDSRHTYRSGLVPAPTLALSHAQLVEERGYTSVGTVYGDYAWGDSLARGVEEYFPEGVDVYEATAPADETDFTPYLREFPEDVELVMGIGHPPGYYSFYRQLLELGIDPDLFTAVGEPTQATWDAVGEDATRSFAVFHNPDVYDDEFADVAQRYYEETGDRMDISTALGYVQATQIARAVEQAESTNPADVSDAIRTTTFDSLFVNPIEYTEWGELRNVRLICSTYESGAPDYYPDGEYRIVENWRSETLPAYDPEELPLE